MAVVFAETLASLDIPQGAFQLVHGDVEVAESLVDHPATPAAGFTGSLRVGRALFDRAAARDTPIPVFAEMGSVNPAFVLPEALESRAKR